MRRRGERPQFPTPAVGRVRCGLDGRAVLPVPLLGGQRLEPVRCRVRAQPSVKPALAPPAPVLVVGFVGDPVALGPDLPEVDRDAALMIAVSRCGDLAWDAVAILALG